MVSVVSHIAYRPLIQYFVSGYVLLSKKNGVLVQESKIC